MLVLSRQRDETIMIGDDIEITVVDIRGDKVRLGITAPGNVAVHRKEVYHAIQRDGRRAAAVSQAEISDSEILWEAHQDDIIAIAREHFQGGFDPAHYQAKSKEEIKAFTTWFGRTKLAIQTAIEEKWYKKCSTDIIYGCFYPQIPNCITEARKYLKSTRGKTERV